LVAYYVTVAKFVGAKHVRREKRTKKGKSEAWAIAELGADRPARDGLAEHIDGGVGGLPQSHFRE
jgi:hypothetical protein